MFRRPLNCDARADRFDLSGCRLSFYCCSFSRKDELVTRDEIARKLWGDDVYLNTNTAINVVVRKARQALRDDADDPKFLLTVPSKGYRFVGTVSEETAVPAGPDAAVAEAVPSVETTPHTVPDAAKKSWLRSWMVWTALGVLALTMVILGRSYLRRLVKPSTRRILLAVLPFKNLSGDPNQEYVVDGLTEETITDLGQTSPAQMGVIARTSAMAYKNTDKTVGQIGRELGVDYVLEGSMRSEGGRSGLARS